ncbi:transaldolase, partial [Saccharopolyspora griseoalba]
AQQVFDQLREAGIDLDDVFAVLEADGVQKFEKSWTELLDTVAQQLEQAE